MMSKITLFLIFLLIAIPSYSQRKRTKVPKESTKSLQNISARQGFITTELNEGVENLPPQFLGHDIVKVFDNLKSLPLEKSEFESSSDYSERINRLLKNNLFGNLDFGSTFVFSYTPGQQRHSSDLLKADYEADKQILSVSIYSQGYYLPTNSQNNKDYNSSDLQSLNVFDSPVRKYRDFVGETRYGKHVNVLAADLDIYKLVFPNCIATINSTEYSYGREKEKTIISTSEAVIEVAVPPLEAVDLKYNLGVLIIGRLIPPYVRSDKGFLFKATIKSPYEAWLLSHHVFFAVNSMWIYSRKSGKIFKKIPKCSLKSPRSDDRSRDYYHYFF